jgi:hypothetical protein
MGTSIFIPHKNMIMKKPKMNPPITLTNVITHNSVAEGGNLRCLDAQKINTLV